MGCDGPVCACGRVSDVDVERNRAGISRAGKGTATLTCCTRQKIGRSAEGCDGEYVCCRGGRRVEVVGDGALKREEDGFTAGHLCRRKNQVPSNWRPRREGAMGRCCAFAFGASGARCGSHQRESPTCPNWSAKPSTNSCALHHGHGLLVAAFSSLTQPSQPLTSIITDY